MVRCPLLWYCHALSGDEAPPHIICNALASDIGALHFEDSKDNLEVKEAKYEETNGTTVISEQKSIIEDPDDHQVPYPFKEGG